MKSALRKIYKERRGEMGEEVMVELSKNITGRCVSFLNEHPAFKHIHLFLPISSLNEINTFFLLDRLFQMDKQVYSSMTDFQKMEMKTVLLSPKGKIRLDEFGIPVPESPVFVENPQIDLVFVPLLAVDVKGNRLGYGKGLYDRFLSKLDPEVFKIGLSFFPPEKYLPTSSHDISLNACIFPDKILNSELLT
ncbi:MAG: 5-formyltetrahydrofolate cyclo-ligase [Cyclobacteriaceae bacterium]